MKIRYLHPSRSANGREYWFYRRAGQRIPIEDESGNRLFKGDPGFLEAYGRIHKTFERTPAAAPGHGTIAALAAEYYQSGDFTNLAPKSQKDYRRYIDPLVEKYGDLKVADMSRAFVRRYRDRFKDKPRTANYVASVIRRLMSFAVDEGLRPDNPAQRPRQLKTGPGHRPWEEDEIQTFRKAWALGTRERTALEMLLYTAQRGGDVAAMQRGRHYTPDRVSVRQDKTSIYVSIPAARDLVDAIDAWMAQQKQDQDADSATVEHLTILTGERGNAITVDTFRHMMRAAIRAAGLPDDCTTHGLRYTAATRVYELTKDWVAVADITGHATMEMAKKYSRQKRRAALTIRRLDKATDKPET